MMRQVVSWSLHFRFVVVGIASAMMLFGIGQLGSMPVDVFPEFAPPTVEVQTSCLGLSAAEVESLVTIPLEVTLNGLPGLDVVRSKSVSQLSSIELLFESGTDVIAARQLVQERLALVAPGLPSWATPPVMIQPLSATSRVMKIGLSSADMSAIELSQLARWTIRTRLMDVPGVANVPIWGQRQQVFNILVDPARLKANGLTLDEVKSASNDALDAGLLQFSEGSIVGTGGFIETANQRLEVRHVLPVRTGADLAQVVVAVRGGHPLLLGDVASIEEGHPPLIGDAVIDDGPGLMLVIYKFPWANTLEVTKGVEDALAQLRPGLGNVHVDPTIFREATFIEVALQNLTLALLLGCLLVVLVLVAFLFEWRSAVISLIAIPLSLMAAALVLAVTGATINTMVIAGFVIAVGVVVDDAIVDVENIMRRLREHRRAGRSRSIGSVILEASLEVRSAIIYATLIIVLALVPVFFLEGLSGAFFQPLAIAYALAVFVSMIVALTVTPALAYILLSRAPVERRDPPLVRLLQRVYHALLVRIIGRPNRAFAAVAVIVIVGAGLLPSLGQSFFPAFKERDFLIHWVTSPSTSQPEVVRITTQVSKELRAIPGVRNFGAHIGQALAADEIAGIYFAENWISVDPAADYDATLTAIQEVVDGYPGLQRDVQTYLNERIHEVLTGGSEAVVVRLFGPDLTTLHDQAVEIRDALSGIDGIEDLVVEPQTPVPQIEVQVDLAAAERYGLSPGEVRRATAAYLASEEVNDTWQGGRVFDVRVWGTPAIRHSLTDVRELLIDIPAGGQVRLADVASVEIKPTPNEILRENASRRIDVGANVRGRDLGAFVKDVERAVATVEFPLGYHPEVLGEFAERQAAEERLVGFGIAALIGIFLLLQLAFGSWRLAAFAFFTLPSALVGGVIAAWLTGGVISLGSLVGFFTVLGIAARNGILLINHYQHLERYEGEVLGVDLVLRGARERLAPILMTALATALALVPLVVAGNIPGHEIELPMAVVILGGLVTSTLLNLLIVPALYLRFAKPSSPPPALATV